MKRNSVQRLRSSHRRPTAPRRRSDDVQHAPAPEVMALDVGLLQNDRAAPPHRQHQALGMAQRYGNHSLQRAITSNDPTLHMGARSSAVETMQGLLAQHGQAINADGIFGPQTRQAVIAFQQANGLRPDGVVGSQTWAALRGSGGGATTQAKVADPKMTVAQAKLAQIKAIFKMIAEQPQTPNGEHAQAEVTMSLPDQEQHAGHNHDWLDDALEWTEDTVGDVVGGVTDVATDIGETVSGVAGEVYDYVDDTVSDVTGAVGDAVGGAVGGAVDWVEDTVTDIGGAVGDAVGGAVDWAEDTVGDVGEWLGDTVGAISEAVGDEYNRLKEIVSDIATNIADALPALDELLGDLKKKVNELFGVEDEEEREDPISFTIGDIDSGVKTVTVGCDGPVRRQRINAVLNVVDGKGTPIGAPIIAHDELRSNLSLQTQAYMNDPEAVVPASDFGITHNRVKSVNTQITASYWGDYVNVTSTILVESGYSITERPGRKDITNPEDPQQIDDQNWADAAVDLDPAMRTRGGYNVPQRDQFWCSDLTRAHEQFHVDDVLAFAKTYMPQATAWFSQQTVDVPFFDTESSVRKQVYALLDTLKSQFANAITAHMGDAGEVRAHNAIAGSYSARSAKIIEVATRNHWGEDPTKAKKKKK